ncbi:hypothetical protein LZ32DRAFT_94797 [Colletotrichum eremochloae]|nr:hypothetical protein LZ32DRAFT_94797 [Colletotrichum eremochloae]
MSPRGVRDPKNGTKGTTDSTSDRLREASVTVSTPGKGIACVPLWRGALEGAKTGKTAAESHELSYFCFIFLILFYQGWVPTMGKCIIRCFGGEESRNDQLFCALPLSPTPLSLSVGFLGGKLGERKRILEKPKRELPWRQGVARVCG